MKPQQPAIKYHDQKHIKWRGS